MRSYNLYNLQQVRYRVQEHMQHAARTAAVSNIALELLRRPLQYTMVYNRFPPVCVYACVVCAGSMIV